jgi:hypothetical protein
VGRFTPALWRLPDALCLLLSSSSPAFSQPAGRFLREEKAGLLPFPPREPKELGDDIPDVELAMC